jgi:hypothetical protein
MTPPTAQRVTASVVNWVRMFFFVAPKSLADTDFAGPLCDRNEHDVHDADAAYHEPDAGYGDHEDDQAASKLVPESGKGVRAHDFEVVGGFHFDLAADAEYLPDLFLDQRLVLLVVVADAYLLVAERFDGVQVGGLPGWIDAERAGRWRRRRRSRS